jgi:hypothetical protein
MFDWLDSIFGYLGDTVITYVEEFLVWLYQLIIVVFEVLYQLLIAVANFFWSIAKAVANFFKGLWENFFKDIFLRAWNAIKTGWQWLEAKLRPLIDFLKRLRKLYQIYFNTYIRPILLLIQHVRQYLQILSFLGVSLARKLDAYLAQLQGKIVQAFATVTATLNVAIDLLNALADPSYLIRKPALLLSIRRQLPALIRAVTGRPPGYWFPSPKGASGGVFSPPKFPFNFTDPAQNPPTSTYLPGDDGLGDLSGSLVGFQFADGAVDQAAPLDYFNDDLYPDTICPYGDAAKCFLYSVGITSA